MLRSNETGKIALICLAVLGCLGIAVRARGQETGKVGELVNPAGTVAAEGQQSAPPAGTANGPQQSPPLDWLAGTPDMFGDFFRVGSQLQFTSITPTLPSGVLDLPLAAGNPRLSVADNNGTLPQDRVYFLYNHFQNALSDQMTGPPSGPMQQTFCVDRYTLGCEKSFLDHTWSVELRMPLAGTSDFSTNDAAVSGGNVGNLAVVVKRLVYESDTAAAAIGLGIDTPTGSDVHGTLLATDFTVHNQAVCLVPYIAFVKRPSENFFCQGFLSLNVPTNGNRVDFGDRGNGVNTLGTLNESTLLQLDLEAGRWLYRNPCAKGLTGLAFVGELHYTTSLQDADRVGGTISSGLVQWQFGDVADRTDILDLTIGLHGELAGSTLCRVGLAVPLQNGPNRGFDSEILVQIERRF